jgi:probable addiction module antidote protein
MKPMITEFDPAAYLDNEEVIAEYLSAALSAGDLELPLTAIGNVVKARGMTQIAREAGLSSLYTSFYVFDLLIKF